MDEETKKEKTGMERHPEGRFLKYIQNACHALELVAALLVLVSGISMGRNIIDVVFYPHLPVLQEDEVK